MKQFVDEAKLTVRLRHSNIVRTFRCFKAGSDYLMVQELVAGRTLQYMMDAFKQAGQMLPMSASTYIGICLMKALDYIHHNDIVHCDIKTENILVGEQVLAKRRQMQVKLLDFGLARSL